VISSCCSLSASLRGSITEGHIFGQGGKGPPGHTAQWLQLSCHDQLDVAMAHPPHEHPDSNTLEQCTMKTLPGKKCSCSSVTVLA
jgi:hypothetical protein